MALKERKIYPKWKAIARGGRLYFENDSKFSEHLIPYEGKELEVVVKQPTKDRSRQEEKFYHAVVVRSVAMAMDAPDQEAHEFLKRLLLTVEESREVEERYDLKGNIVPAHTVRYKRVMSTTELTDKAYREYWENCIRWAAQPTMPTGLNQSSGLGIYIPYPNEVDYENW